MSAYPDIVIRRLSERFHIEEGFLVQCVEESVVEIHEAGGQWEFANGTALRLRRLERLCRALDVDVPVANLILSLAARVSELENAVDALRKIPEK